MYYSAFGLLAILILLIENQDILRNLGDGLNKPAWRVYRRFLLAVLAYYVTDVLWGLLESRKLALLLFADTTVYFVTMAAGVLFWAQFTVAYLEEEHGFGQFLVHAGWALAGLITAIAAANMFTPLLFTVSADSVYRALPLRYVILAAQILMLLLLSVFAFLSYMRQRGAKERGNKYLALALYGLIMALFLFIQLWWPYLPLYSVAYMLGTCVMHTFVVIDEKEAYRRGLEEAARISALKDTIVSLLDNMPAMTYTKDAETGAYLACNQAFANYAHKARPAEVAGLTDAQIFDQETAARVLEDDRMALSMDEPYIFFEDVHDTAGNRRQFQTTKLKYHNFVGRLCVLGMSQDVTDLVRIRRESATSKEAYAKERGAGIIYAHIAQALARGYSELYYINLDTEEYTEYRTDDDTGTLTEVRRGWHFFETCRLEAEQVVHPDDRAMVISALDRKTLVAALDRNRTFVMTYRLISEGGPVYVSSRICRMQDDGRYIVLGVSDVDELMKQRRATERMKEEQIAYARLSALTGDFLCIYVVVPETGRYRDFSATQSYQSFAQAKEGQDFFEKVREAARTYNHPDDLNRFLSAFTRENIMAEIARYGIFMVSYRLMMDGAPRYVQLKAAMVEEKEGARLIVGINDIDAQVRQEEAYVEHMAKARIKAKVDALTGVKNKLAFQEAEARLNAQIEEQRAPEFAIVILDVNDLKKVNDTEGHKAGDQYIRDACRIICETFKRSPVFRVGGDEFAVIAQGNDYAHIDALMDRVREQNAGAQRGGSVVIACGMARCEGDPSVAAVFERADQNMYEDKSRLKAGRE